MKAGRRGNRADRPGVRFSLVRNLSPAPPFRTSEWLGAWQGVGGVGRGWFYIPAQQGDLSVSSGGKERGSASLGGISVPKILFSLSPKRSEGVIGKSRLPTHPPLPIPSPATGGSG